MRVLFVNGRDDATSVPGGDAVQIEKTKEALENCGITILVRDPDRLDDLPPCDLAHVFNIQMPECSWKVFQTLRKKGVPIVLSPIYWDMYAYWFELARTERRSWRSLVSLVGIHKAQRVYIFWQQKKATRNQDWQLQRMLLESAERILPNSLSEVVELRQSFLLDKQFPSKVDVIPNAIDVSLFDSLDREGEPSANESKYKDCVLEVGTINPVKNQMGVLNALFDTDYHMVFIGHTPPNYKDYAVDCKMRAAQRGNVIFLDHIPHSSLPDIYRAAAVHVLPSWRETPGLVSLEAAASGCRIVSTSIGSARDYFSDMAWYCYPSDPDSIRTAVNQAMISPRSNELRKRILSNYSWEHTAQATLAAYDKVG